MKVQLLHALLLVFFAISSTATAQVNFNFNYLDPDGVGFNATGQVGADRRAGLQLAGDYISSVLGSGYSANIVIDVKGDETNDNFLAGANTQFPTAYPGDGFTTVGHVRAKIFGGDAADPDPTGADGFINWNFEDFQWEPFNDFQSGEIDLQNTAIHELTHTLGFGVNIAENGTSLWQDSAGTTTSFQPFARFLADSNGRLIDENTFQLDADRWNAVVTGGTGPLGLLFDGSNARAANGGQDVYLYSPTTYNDAGSHTDTDFYTGMGGTVEHLMNHASTRSEGLDIRQYSALEIGMLKDIGYTLIGVPEPSSVAILLFGSMLGFSVRRR